MAPLLRLLAAWLMLSACSRPDALSAAPPLTLPDLSGKTVSLSDFSGKIVLLDFWATWCEPCREELPDLLKLQQTYSSRGFTILGVSMDSAGKSFVKEYLRRNSVSYPVVLARGQGVEGYRLVGLPTAFLIDGQGRMIKKYLGPKSFAQVSADIAPLLSPPFNR